MDEALSNVRSVKIDEIASKQANGQLLHIVSRLYTDEPLTEPDYNIQVQAVKLKRRVQMYQWIEEESYAIFYSDSIYNTFQPMFLLSCWFFFSSESVYGQSIEIINSEQKTYYYSMDWRDKIVDSSIFYIRSGHENPKEFPIENRIQTANRVQIGGFEIGVDAKAEINNYIEITSDTRPEDPAIKLHSGLYYHSNDVFNPEIGDIRLQFLTAGIEGNFVSIHFQNYVC